MTEATKKVLKCWSKNEKNLAETHDKAGNALESTFHTFANLAMNWIVSDENETEEVNNKLAKEIKVLNALGDALHTLEEVELANHPEYKRIESDISESQGKISAYTFAIQVLTGAVK